MNIIATAKVENLNNIMIAQMAAKMELAYKIKQQILHAVLTLIAELLVIPELISARIVMYTEIT